MHIQRGCDCQWVAEWRPWRHGQVLVFYGTARSEIAMAPELAQPRRCSTTLHILSILAYQARPGSSQRPNPEFVPRRPEDPDHLHCCRPANMVQLTESCLVYPIGPVETLKEPLISQSRWVVNNLGARLYSPCPHGCQYLVCLVVHFWVRCVVRAFQVENLERRPSCC